MPQNVYPKSTWPQSVKGILCWFFSYEISHLLAQLNVHIVSLILVPTVLVDAFADSCEFLRGRIETSRGGEVTNTLKVQLEEEEE